MEEKCRNCKQCATATQKSPLMTFLMEKPSKNAAPCGISINATKQAGGAQRSFASFGSKLPFLMSTFHLFPVEEFFQVEYENIQIRLNGFLLWHQCSMLKKRGDVSICILL